MTPIECAHEADVLAAVCTGRWPDRVDAELKAHVAACEICADVATVAGALESEALAGPPDARLPDSGRVWWRAQVRARDEAVRAAVRPITAAQAIAFTCLVGMAGALFGATSAWFQSGIHWLGNTLAIVNVRGLALPAPIASLLAEHGMLVLVMASCFIVGPVAVYLLGKHD